MVAYRFEDSRGGDYVARHMAGFTGILQVDGYSAYTQLAKAKASSNEAVALAGCWAHLRRRFHELHINGSSRIATQGVTVERAIRPQTIVRKNALFAGSDGGGNTWATIATLLQTAKMNGVDPLAWLT